MSSESSAFDSWRIIRWVTVAILAWGIFHALGAWQFNHNPLRAVVVLGCVVGFLGFWMVMLAARQRRLSRAVPADRAGREPR
jgi:CHASE2 domain-containing sensor protein